MAKTKARRIEDLAKLIHESGREAVALGKVYMKGPDIPVRPFAEWVDLPEDAKDGRRMQAAFLLEKGRRKEVLALIQGY